MGRGSSEPLFHPGERPRLPGEPRADTRTTTSLPRDLRQGAMLRLRVTALVYSAAFFFASLVPKVATRGFEEPFRNPLDWVPAAASILMGLLVAAAAGSSRLGWRPRVYMGLVFEVLGSLGIAIALYSPILLSHATGTMLEFGLSPSWVAIWFIIYSIVVPAPPRLALTAAALSGAAAPAVIWAFLDLAGSSHLISLWHFFFLCVLPNAVCVGLAYSGAYVVYRLGRDVSHARALGSYQLGERLGAGGMGEVWTASHRMLARPAAIKFIRPETIAGTNPDECRLLVKRFEREAQATAALTSSHTVDVYDYGVTDDGTFYYVMELLDGLDLDNLVQRFGPLSPARVVYLLSQACEALEEAHQKGLIHRDVKPANIYACRNGVRYDFVKMLDFGLVAHTRAGSGWDTRLTADGRATGTPAYMPPEIARGAPVDGRTDLYALACVGYWLLTGRPVFTGTSVYEVVSQHLRGAPEPPSRFASNPVPEALEKLLLDCLEKEPARRPADARSVAARLRIVPLSEPWKEDEAEQWWMAHVPSGEPLGNRETETLAVESRISMGFGIR
jgi:hypothetical protein